MKVCILTSAHPALDARVFYKEACSLQKAGYEVVLIAPPVGRATRPEDETVQGVRIRYTPPTRGRLERVANLSRIYQMALEEQADIYHFHDPDLIRTGLKLQKKLGKPVIYDVHEYYGDSLQTRYWLPMAIRSTVAKTFDRYEKQAARKFAGIITVNEHMEAQFKALNPAGVCLYNFPLREQFPFPRPSADQSKWQENWQKQPKILYLGGISQERGLEVILEAMALVRQKIPQAKCDLVGPADEGGLSEKYQPLNEWARKGNIFMLGKIPYKQVPVILQQAHLALVPLLPTLNYQKAIPVKLIEYMAAGLPVVGSRFGYIEKILEEDGCGRLAKPGDPRSFAEEIIALIENPEQTLAYAQQGWDAFRQKYSWEGEEPKLLDFYNNIANQRKIP